GTLPVLAGRKCTSVDSANKGHHNDDQTMSQTVYELGILGAGNMAEAIARGVLNRALFTAEQIIASDPVQDRRALFTNQLRIKTTEDNAEVGRQSNVLLLSTKPYQIKEAPAPVGA